MARLQALWRENRGGALSRAAQLGTVRQRLPQVSPSTMKTSSPLILVAAATAILLIAFLLAQPLKPAVALPELLIDRSLLPDPWNALPLTVNMVPAIYSFGSAYNVSAHWAETGQLKPFLGQWILQYSSPLSAAYAFTILIPLATRSEPGIRTYRPSWHHESPQADQARTQCTDLGTGVPVDPELCDVQIRYGQYIIWLTMEDAPINQTSFLIVIAAVDEYVAQQLRP